MARLVPVLLLLIAAMGLHAAQSAPVCLLVASVQLNESAYTLSGRMSKPVPGVLRPIGMNAVGNVYLQLPIGAGNRCPNLTLSNAADLLAAAKLAQPVDRPPVTLEPKILDSSITSGTSDKIVANFTFEDYEFGLLGNDPIGANAVSISALQEASAPPVSTQTIITRGMLLLATTFGPRRGNLTTVASNTTTSVAITASGPAATPLIRLVIRDANMVYNISPQSTPGVEYTTAVAYVNGSITALADTATNGTLLVVDNTTLDWNALPRLVAPVIVGGNKAGVPCYVSPDACAGSSCPAGAAPAAPICGTPPEVSTAGGAPAGEAAAPPPARSGVGRGAALAAGSAAAAMLLAVLLAA